MIRHRLLQVFLCAAMASTLAAPRAACAQAPAPRPTVWMAPPGHEGGRCFRELFEKPDAWKDARAAIDVLAYADHNLNRQFSDDELGRWLPRLREWGVKLGLEVGAVKPWGPTGRQAFDAERPIWERVQHLGGRIHAIAMDEPLSCARRDLRKPDEYAIQETANFVALVRKHFPGVLVGDIEPYPSISVADLTAWVDALQARLASMGVRGLDFMRLDVDWVSFVIAGRGSWREVRSFEEHCRARKLPFSLIYCASDYPHLKRHGLADDAAWYVSVMRQAYDYALVGGSPDEVVVESWVEAPSRSTPDSGGFSFTQSVLDLCRRIARGARAGSDRLCARPVIS